MLIYYYGEDIYRAEQAIRALAAERHATIQWVDREELTQRPLGEWLGQATGLFGVTLPVVRDPAQLPAALQATVIAAGKAHHGEVIAWERGVPDKRSALWRAWRESAEEFSYQPTPVIARWVEQAVQQRGGTIEPSAATLLVERVGPDGYQLLSMIEKLVLTDTTITPAAVSTEAAAVPAANIFAALDAMTRGQSGAVVRQVETLLHDGHSEFYLLSMLAYQVRTLVLIRAADRPGQSAAALAKATRLHPYVVEKSLPVARRFAVTQLHDVLTRILATDFAIKQGKADPRTGLIMLILSLTEVFAQQISSAAVTRRSSESVKQ